MVFFFCYVGEGMKSTIQPLEDYREEGELRGRKRNEWVMVRNCSVGLVSQGL